MTIANCAQIVADQIAAGNPSPTNGTICKLMVESGAGLGSFIEFISSPVGSLILIIMVVAIVGAVGFGIARMISDFWSR